jgi:hypothetical protein
MTEDELAFQAYSTIAEQINKEEARINERVFQSMVDCLRLSASPTRHAIARAFNRLSEGLLKKV